jgi:hypothetical protein
MTFVLPVLSASKSALAQTKPSFSLHFHLFRESLHALIQLALHNLQQTFAVTGEAVRERSNKTVEEGVGGGARLKRDESFLVVVFQVR